MVYPLRIHLPDLIYHVLNRGNNRQVIFVEESDYQHYLDILKKYKEKFNFKIFAYCLMTNHVHLVLQTSGKASISKIMQAITIAHTRHYHYIYNSSGHVWQGRFRSPLVSDDDYLLAVMRYIEQNPLRAGMVDDLTKYPWSSFIINTTTKKDPLVDKEENPAYLSLGNTDKERSASYLKIVTSVLEEDKLKEIRNTLTGKQHYISERFQEQIKEKLALAKPKLRGRPRKTNN